MNEPWYITNYEIKISRIKLLNDSIDQYYNKNIFLESWKLRIFAEQIVDKNIFFFKGVW